MNVKALSFAAGGFVVCAMLATVWVQRDMDQIDSQATAELTKKCQSTLQMAQASGISHATANEIAKCKTVGVTLAVATPAAPPAPTANANGVVVSEAVSINGHPDSQSSSDTSQWKTDTLARAGTATKNGQSDGRTVSEELDNKRRATRNRTITPADSVPVGETGEPSNKATPSTDPGPPPNAPEPDSPLDGSVSSVLLG